MTWIRRTGRALEAMGLLIAIVSSPFSTGASSWRTVGLLVLVLGLVIVVGIPGALEIIGHRWAAPTLKALQRRYKHPRLVALTQVGAGLVGLGLVIVLAFLRAPSNIPPILYAVFAVGMLTWVAVSMSDFRR